MAQHTLTADELASQINGRVVGDPSVRISGIASLESAKAGELSYVEDEKLFDAARASSASCLLVPEKFADETKTLIVVTRPKIAFALAAPLLHPPKQREPQIHPTAAIAETADIALTAYIGPHVTVGENVHVGPATRIESGVVIGDNVSIGDDCVLHPNVVLYDNVNIGDRVVLHASVCIG